MNDQVQTLREHAGILASRSRIPHIGPSIPIAAQIEELYAALEELQVIEEELLLQQASRGDERRATEGERRRYRDLFDHAPAAYLVMDAKGLIQQANDSAATLLGVPRATLNGAPLAAFIAREQYPQFRAWLSRLATLDGVQRWETRLQPKRAALADVEVSATAHRDRDGSLLEIRLLLHDGGARAREWEALRRREAELDAAIDGSILGVALVDLAGRPFRTNRALQEYLGYSDVELRGMAFTEFTQPDDAAPDWQLFQELIAGGRAHYQIDKRFIRKDGRTVWGRCTVSPICNDDGALRSVSAMVEDITEGRRVEEALRQSEARFRSLVQNSSDLIAVVDGECVVRYISPAVTPLLGYTVEDVLHHSISERVHPDDAEPVRRFLAKVSDDSVSLSPLVMRLQHADRSWRHFEVVASDLRAEPSVGGFVINGRDITAHKRLEEELKRQAFNDSLTGLPNRALFHDRLSHALAMAVRSRSMVAVLFLDLDGFKVVNDSLGHSTGDRLLAEVARRLAASLRPNDTVARFGGDEFAILLDEITGPTDAMRVAHRILATLRDPFTLDGRELRVTASIGVALSTAEAEAGPNELMRAADIAMYQAKAAGKARAVVFDTAMSDRAHQRLDMESALHRALERAEFRLVYQPILDLKDGTITGVEALLRWQHPQRGLIPPGEFIALAEETGLILPIGQWMLEESCRQVQRWQKGRVGRPLSLSVNLSACQFAQPSLSAQVASALAASGLDPALLCLEVTESSLLEEAPATDATVRALRFLGARLAIDDFGTGYSALSYLRRFPMDTLKVDRSFIAVLDGDAPATAIVRSIVTLAHALNMKVTAEGVESAAQLERVRALGCDHAQGFHISAPLDAEALEPMLGTCAG